MRIINLYPNFANEGGAQNSTLFLAKKLDENSKRNIVLYNGNKIAPKYQKCGVAFKKFSLSTILKYRKESIFVSHSRHYTTWLVLLSYILKIRVIHIARNTFDDLKGFTLFPRYCVAISGGVRENLLNYFKLEPKQIVDIPNGIEDSYTTAKSGDEPYIKILLPGRICTIKQQVELVKAIGEKIPSHVKIYFAGVGEDEELLGRLIEDKPQLSLLGHIDINREIWRYDYILLFSQKEGLARTLIEGCMHRKPLLTNNILSALDINIDNHNGFVFDSWDALAAALHSLPERGSESYERLAANSRALFLERFQAETMLTRYRALIAKVEQSTK